MANSGDIATAVVRSQGADHRARRRARTAVPQHRYHPCDLALLPAHRGRLEDERLRLLLGVFLRAQRFPAVPAVRPKPRRPGRVRTDAQCAGLRAAPRGPDHAVLSGDLFDRQLHPAAVVRQQSGAAGRVRRTHRNDHRPLGTAREPDPDADVLPAVHPDRHRAVVVANARVRVLRDTAVAGSGVVRASQAHQHEPVRFGYRGALDPDGCRIGRASPDPNAFRSGRRHRSDAAILGTELGGRVHQELLDERRQLRARHVGRAGVRRTRARRRAGTPRTARACAQCDRDPARAGGMRGALCCGAAFRHRSSRRRRRIDDRRDRRAAGPFGEVQTGGLPGRQAHSLCRARFRCPPIYGISRY